MEKIIRAIRKILPDYSVFPLFMALLVNGLVYNGSRWIAGGWYHHNIESWVDRKIPVVPEFLLIYFGCYLFWAVNYILIARLERERVYRFFTAEFLSRIICLGFFLLYPTTNTRPVITEGGFWNWALSALYQIDAADNLFPSIHCVVSWFCYIGIRGRKEIPVWYQRCSLIFAGLVFLSTLFTKQHVIFDILGGVFTAQVCFWLSQNTGLYKIYERVGNKAEAKIQKYK